MPKIYLAFPEGKRLPPAQICRNRAVRMESGGASVWLSVDDLRIVEVKGGSRTVLV